MATPAEPPPETVPSGRVAANQAARRRRVIQAAVELAAEGGYDVVQMRDVAARANVALGTIYRYFESKDQLLAAAQVEWARDLERRIGSRSIPEGTPVDRVVALIRRASRAMERNQQLSSALTTAMASADPGIHRYQSEINDIMTGLLCRALEGMEPERRDAAVRVLTHVWFAALIGWVHGWRQVGTVGDEMEFAARFLLDG